MMGWIKLEVVVVVVEIGGEEVRREERDEGDVMEGGRRRSADEMGPWKREHTVAIE